ncbi:Ditrans,polycis-undecaprenyl-diphosphate synthase ((2E,6E)-farnesyl-diphosphate specific) [Rickettsiales endosymbiont of Paramecium tredecaurelia]|uniref:polyprenyl diphosphate synthase n=1 Tax=Candidatus Sarmatiella mevalonica TaxID=2770581 RepID=UPI001920FE6B|nr:polyprenyl diphosphate synthase [Candidatus Sarmatiella mevalonica]MBL3285285.1 Ditrans,polycis-undecaprenyl-diphosphate synthase ((2E,6E)-farnesyl-diphosphate specific) [Candidatus Sarmatiella mevalonica]
MSNTVQSKAKSSTLKHLAIIMDGNARWASSNGLKASDGYLKGAQTASNLIRCIKKYDIPYLTLYTFSHENWRRSEDEVRGLIDLFVDYLKQNKQELIDNQVQLKVLGRIAHLPPEVLNLIHQTTQETQLPDARYTLVIAFGYGGKQEIVDACQKIIQSHVKQVSEELIQAHLYDPHMPAVDLLIRTGGMLRISNFLLWQIAYAEMIFLDKFWPEFNEDDLQFCLNDYHARKRTLGIRMQDDLDK